MGKKLIVDPEFDGVFGKYFPTTGRNFDAGYSGASQAGKGLGIALSDSTVIEDDEDRNEVTITRVKPDGTCSVVMVDFKSKTVFEQAPSLGGGTEWQEHRFAQYVTCPEIKFGKDDEGREIPLTLAAQNDMLKRKAEAEGFAFHPVKWDPFASNKYVLAAHFARGGQLRPFFEKGGHQAAEWWKKNVYLGYCKEMGIEAFTDEDPTPAPALGTAKKAVAKK